MRFRQHIPSLPVPSPPPWHSRQLLPVPAQSPTAGTWTGGWILTVRSHFLRKPHCYSCTLPAKSSGKGAALPGMEKSGGAGPASPIPAMLQTICVSSLQPLSQSWRGGVASLESHELERGCSHQSGNPGLGYSLRRNK